MKGPRKAECCANCMSGLFDLSDENMGLLFPVINCDIHPGYKVTSLDVCSDFDRYDFDEAVKDGMERIEEE